MKKLLLLLVITFTLNSYSQISFEKGYFITNSDKKIECLIKNVDWVSSPVSFKYKESEKDEIKETGIEAVKEFGIYNSSKFLRETVQIHNSSDDINNLSYNRNPVFTEKQVFLTVLIEGKANLYTYGNSKKYFFKTDNTKIEQLIFIKFKNSYSEVAENKLYQKQLWDNLKCDRIKTTDVGKLLYTKNSLIDFFILYNNCNGTTSITDNSKIVNYDSKEEKKDLFNLNIKTRINNVTMAVQNEMNDFRDTDFGKKTNFGIGVEAEFILPVNKNKWALFLEPTFQSFNGEVTNEKTALYGFGVLTAKSDYNSVELPIGIRHYFFLNPNSKIFLNAAFVYDLSFGSSIKFIKTDGSTQDSLEISNGNNFAFGLGYKLYDKLSLELRYNSNRDFLSKYSAWSSDYKSFSIILGYTLF